MARRRMDDIDGSPGTPGNLIAIALEQIDGPPAYCAKAK